MNALESPDKDAILKAFLSGYIMNTAFLQMDGSYRTCFSHHVGSHYRLLTLDCRNPPIQRPFQSRKSKENRSNHVSRVGILSSLTF